MTMQGQDLLDALIAGQKQMKITRAVVGSGTVAATVLNMQTAVTDPVQEAALNDVVVADGTVMIPVVITNMNLEVGYTAKQVGIYAQADNEEEILFFIAQSDAKGLDIPSKNEPPHGFTAEFHFTLDTGTATNLQITVNSAGLLTAAVADQRYEKKAVVKTYTIKPALFAGTGFPYTYTVAHELGAEPSSMPLVDVQLSGYATQEEVEAAEMAYSTVYRVAFDAENLVLFAKEVPETEYTLVVKAVM